MTASTVRKTPIHLGQDDAGCLTYSPMARACLLAGTAMLRSFRSGRAGMNPARMIVGG